MDYSKEQYEIMRTAFLTAFPKIFTNIDYSMDFFRQILDKSREYGFSFLPEQFTAKMAPEIEARYKAASAKLREILDHCQKEPIIVEIASGMSSRCLDFSGSDFYEIDFPPIMKIKADIASSLMPTLSEYRFVGLDLSKKDELESYLNNLVKENEGRPILFLSEGLFWYLSRDDITSLAETIKIVLQKTDGCWISTDCPVDQQYKDSNLREYRSVVVKSSHREDKKPFHGFEEFAEFFDNIGFEIRCEKLLDLVSVSEISSARLFGCSESEVADRLNSYTDVATFYYKN